MWYKSLAYQKQKDILPALFANCDVSEAGQCQTERHPLELSCEKPLRKKTVHR